MKRVLAVLLAVMLLMAVIPATSMAETASNGCSTYKVYRVSTNGGHLMLRSGPGTSYRVLASLCNGRPLKYLYSDGNWYKVRTFNGMTGWVSRHYVRCGAYANVNTRTSGLNYRTGPGTGYGIKGSFAKGTRNLYVTKVSGNWAYVTANKVTGYVSMTYLKFT